MYTADDGTVYRTKNRKYNQTIEVLHSSNKYLHQLYALVDKSLGYYYQPITFDIEDGIVLYTGSESGYIKSICLDDSKDVVHITIFGSDIEFDFPLYPESMDIPDRPLITPVQENIEGTYLFTTENCIQIGDIKIHAILRDDTPILECKNKFRLQGVALAATDKLIYVKSGKIDRVYTLYDDKLNISIDNMPSEIRIQLSGTKLLLSGPLLINSGQYFIVHEMYRLDDYSIEFIVSTLENPALHFKLAISHKTDKTYTVYLNGKMTEMRDCEDYNNLLEVTYGNKQGTFTGSKTGVTLF